MNQQLDFFRAPAPVIVQPTFIGPDNTLMLAPPSWHPVGAEAAERKAARLREIEDRRAAKVLETVLNSEPGGTRWKVEA